MDDEVLYQQVRHGDEAALAELVTRYHTPIYRFLYRYTSDSALADDLAQETFIRLLAFRGTPRAHFRPWLYTIAINLARDHFRSAVYRYEPLSFDDEAEQIVDDSLPESAHSDVVAALMKLPPIQREVILLRFYHDLKLEEIADITGAPLGTVKSRLFHALKGLKGFLAITEIRYDRS